MSSNLQRKQLTRSSKALPKRGMPAPAFVSSLPDLKNPSWMNIRFPCILQELIQDQSRPHWLFFSGKPQKPPLKFNGEGLRTGHPPELTNQPKVRFTLHIPPRRVPLCVPSFDRSDVLKSSSLSNVNITKPWSSLGLRCGICSLRTVRQ